MKHRILYSIALVGVLSFPANKMAGAADPLTTIAEQSGFQRTGRYDEVIALCAAFEKAIPALCGR